MNNCNFDCNLTDWKIKDEANHEFIFPNFILKSGKTVTVYSGCGKNEEDKLYWCSKHAIWNNDKDTLYLYDLEYNIVLTYRYGYK